MKSELEQKQVPELKNPDRIDKEKFEKVLDLPVLPDGLDRDIQKRLGF